MDRLAKRKIQFQRCSELLTNDVCRVLGQRHADDMMLEFHAHPAATGPQRSKDTRSGGRAEPGS